jgi:hypothetical protein
MKTARILSLAAVAVVSSALSCGWLSAKNYNVDKTSPNGTYRVKVGVRVEEEGDLFGHFTERGKIEVFKAWEIIYNCEWKVRDNWESTFIDANPVIEWLGENILRMGLDRSNQPFSDELMISNDTDETLKSVEVSCGKYEQFRVFDIAPGGRIVLRPAPKLNFDVSGDFYLGYGGETQGGKKFAGALKQKQPDSSIRLEITVNAKDLK